MLTLISLDKMQNISIRNLRTGHFESCSSETGLSPPVNTLTDRSKALPFWWIICAISVLCLSCFLVCSLLPCWEPAGKRLTSWLSFVVLNFVVDTFPFGILGQVWYLIVLIPDLCPLSYFHTVHIVLHILAVLFQ